MAKILVIDDDRDLVETTRIVLEKEGFDVATAHNRADGFDAVKEEKPELILLDVMMEEEDDGFVLAQKIRKEGIETPIIILSNINRISGMKYDKDDEMVPVNDFLEKPIEPGKLIEKINKYLG
ncbi:MAG: response regulator transcription factor [Candidatus Zixiibacteriota bacterium]